MALPRFRRVFSCYVVKATQLVIESMQRCSSRRQRAAKRHAQSEPCSALGLKPIDNSYSCQLLEHAAMLPAVMQPSLLAANCNIFKAGRQHIILQCCMWLSQHTQLTHRPARQSPKSCSALAVHNSGSGSEGPSLGEGILRSWAAPEPPACLLVSTARGSMRHIMPSRLPQSVLRLQPCRPNVPSCRGQSSSSP